MKIFDFRRRLVDDYAGYTRGFIQVREPRLREFINRQLDEGVLWPEPLIQLLSFFEIRLIFVETDSRNPFCLLTLTGTKRLAGSVVFVFDARSVDELADPAKGRMGHQFNHRYLGPDAGSLALLCGNYNSFLLDYLLRSSLSQASIPQGVFEQLPVLTPSTYAHSAPWSEKDTVLAWVLARTLELTYTAWDLQSFAADCGFDGAPFRWDEERRLLLRSELDAAFFHLYLGTGDWRQANGEPDADFARLKEAFPTPRHAVEYIRETFSLVRQADDAMTVAHASGSSYRTLLEPAPADPRCRYAARDGSLTAGAVRTLMDLINGLPATSFRLRLSEADISPGQPTRETLRAGSVSDGTQQPQAPRRKQPCPLLLTSSRSRPTDPGCTAESKVPLIECTMSTERQCSRPTLNGNKRAASGWRKNPIC